MQRSERQEGMQRSRHETARPREQLVQGPAAQIRTVEQTAIKTPCCRGEESPSRHLKAQQVPGFGLSSLAFILVAIGNHFRVSSKMVMFLKRLLCNL